MKKKRSGRGTARAYGLLLLLIAIIWALAISDGGLGILAHWGIKGEKCHTVTALCTDIDIAYRFNMVRNSTEKSYTFHLDHGQSYRINATASALSKIGLTEEDLNDLAGSVLTVEYIDIRFPVYPLLSLEAERETLIPKDFALQQWDAIWGSAHLILAFVGGIGILILLCDNLPPLIRSIRKKIRLRRKKLRRQQQLERKSRKEP